MVEELNKLDSSTSNFNMHNLHKNVIFDYNSKVLDDILDVHARPNEASKSYFTVNDSDDSDPNLDQISTENYITTK